MPIMTILNKLGRTFSNILKLITTQNGFTLRWAGKALCSLKYKILKYLTSCPVFLDLSKFDEGLWNAVIEKLVGRSAKEVTIVNRDGSKVEWKMV